MKSFRWTALAFLLLAACEIDPTPDEYFDHQATAQEESDQVAAEVRDRVLAMGQALGRGSSRDALLALSPARDVDIVGEPAGAADTFAGSAQIDAILGELATRQVAIRDVQVEVGSRGTVAWFRALLEGAEADSTVRVTGVYVLSEGALQLVQAHFSSPLTAPAQSPSDSLEAAGDSLEDG